MVVRIHLRRPSVLRNARTLNRQLALAAATLMSPASVMACALGVWRLGADLKWTGSFAIASGIFSHWQVWFALAAFLQLAALALYRYGRDEAAS